MQEKIAIFEKVGLKEFTRSMLEIFPAYQFEKDQLEIMLNEIPMPRRSTKGSAGYDFFAPFEFVLRPGTAITIPTGIRVKFVDSDGNAIKDSDWALIMIPKSGIGTKTSIRLSNTIGLVDCDYYFSDNEGHIMIKLEMPSDNVTTADSHTSKYESNLNIYRKAYKFEEHTKFVQGMFIKFGITTDDDIYEKDDRNGGFGSTGSTDNKIIEGSSSGDPSTDENAEAITDDDLMELLNS